MENGRGQVVRQNSQIGGTPGRCGNPSHVRLGNTLRPCSWARTHWTGYAYRLRRCVGSCRKRNGQKGEGSIPGGVYRIKSREGPVGIGAAGSFWLTISAVGKPNSDGVPYCIPNEFICGEIGRFLRLPVPPGGLVKVRDEDPPRLFASLDFNFTGESLPPIDATRCVERLPDLSTGVLIFDILIANSDRNHGNISVDFSTDPPQMSVFDHGHALLGPTPNQGQQTLNNVRESLGIPNHCLHGALSTSEYFDKWMERISAIPGFLIADLCEEMVGYGMITEAEGNAAQNFLVYRRDNLPRIIGANRGQFTAIEQWGLTA